jgi:hypothetical protein
MTTAKSVGIVAAIPQFDLGEFARLDDDVKEEVVDLIAVMKVCLANQGGALAHLANVAQANGHRRGWCYKTLESKYYKFRETGDWHCLVNKAKQRGLGKSRWMTPAVIEHWKTRCMNHSRSYRSAYIELCAEYKVGSRIGDVDWSDVWKEHADLAHIPLPPKPPKNMPLPEGWSYKNFLRHQPLLIEKLGARQGLNAAKKMSVHVRTTRAGMEPGQQYMFDDLKHDRKITFEKQLIRVWELACLDVASGHKVAYGLKPNVWNDEAQARENLRTRDMRYLLAHILINHGYHPDGCELHIENGTASLLKRFDLLLNELSGGVIRVVRAGIDRKVACLSQWGAKGGGNPNAKSPLESHHNLVHNRMDYGPGLTGSNERLNAPEDTAALESYTDKLIKASEAMPPELARRLAFPVWDMGLFREAVSEAYKGIATRTDHELEGWDGHMQRMWRTSITDDWHTEAEWFAYSEKAREGMTEIIMQEGYHCIARKSPLQVWNEGKQKLVRLPDYSFALLCGKELAEKRPCPATGEIIFVDRTVDPEPMRYRLSSCCDEFGMAVELAEGEIYYWLINPFNPDMAFVLGEHGEYVGKVQRQNTVARMDTEEIGREIGRATRDLNERLAPLARRGAKLAKARLEDIRNNTEVLSQAAGENEIAAAVERSVSADRRAAMKGVSLDDLTVSFGGDISDEGGTAGIDQLS